MWFSSHYNINRLNDHDARYKYWHQLSTRHATSARSLKVVWQWLTMLHQSVGWHITSFDRSTSTVVTTAGRRKATLVQVFISSLQDYSQLCTLRHHRQLTSKTAVSTECSSQVDHVDRVAWTPRTRTEGITLAAYPTPSWFQPEHPNVQVTAWYSFPILVEWMPAGAWRQSPTTFIWQIHSAVPLTNRESMTGRLLFPVIVFSYLQLFYCTAKFARSDLIELTPLIFRLYSYFTIFKC